VTDSSVQAVNQMDDVALRSYFDPCQLTNSDEFQEAIRSIKVGKAPGSNGIPNRALKHLPQRAVSLLAQIFNALLLTHHLPSVEARSSDLYS